MHPDKPTEIDFEAARLVGRTCLALKVQTASRVLGRRYDDAFRAIGLTSGQFSLMMMLNQPDQLTVSQLAAALGMDRTTTTANLKPLERRDLVVVAPDPKDARVRRISLTEAGMALLSLALPHWRNLNQPILDRMSAEEQAALSRAFDVLMEFARAETSVGVFSFPPSP